MDAISLYLSNAKSISYIPISIELNFFPYYNIMLLLLLLYSCPRSWLCFPLFVLRLFHSVSHTLFFFSLIHLSFSHIPSLPFLFPGEFPLNQNNKIKREITQCKLLEISFKTFKVPSVQATRLLVILFRDIVTMTGFSPVQVLKVEMFWWQGK